MNGWLALAVHQYRVATMTVAALPRYMYVLALWCLCLCALSMSMKLHLHINTNVKHWQLFTLIELVPFCCRFIEINWVNVLRVFIYWFPFYTWHVFSWRRHHKQSLSSYCFRSFFAPHIIPPPPFAVCSCRCCGCVRWCCCYCWWCLRAHLHCLVPFPCSFHSISIVYSEHTTHHHHFDCYMNKYNWRETQHNRELAMLKEEKKEK